MRYAVISDIHANLEALEVALNTLEDEGVDEYFILGDLVGYNASPGEVVDRVQKLDPCYCISGNHDRYLTGETPMRGVRGVTAETIEWTRDQVSEEQYNYVDSLDTTCEVDEDWLLVHGSPRDKDEYILSMNGMRKNLRYLEMHYPDVEICFFGHTHIPSVVSAEQHQTTFEEDRTIPIQDSRPVLINPGSVGQPRDGVKYSSFALFDTEEMEVTIFRRPYEISETQRKIRDAGLAEKSAERLEQGF